MLNLYHRLGCMEIFMKLYLGYVMGRSTKSNELCRIG